MIGEMTIFALVVFSWLFQPGLVVAAGGDRQSETAADSTRAAETTQAGIADGERSPALTGERRPLYRLHTSDVLEIDFSFSPQLNQTVTVQPDGFIPLRGVEPLYAEGSTLTQLQAGIVRAYAAVLHDPVATVVLKDFDKPYFIAAGEVGRPGKYELRADTTVTEAVAIAGGFTARAKHSQVVLFRRISQDTVESHLLNVKAMLKAGTKSEDVHLRPGDLLFVPQNMMSKIRQYLPSSNMSLYASPTQF